MEKASARVGFVGCSLVLLVAFLGAGCATSGVPRPLPAQARQWGKAAFVQEMILPPSLPVIPLVQAGIYRGSFNKIETDVEKLHQERIDGYEDLLGQHLSTSFPFSVVYGKELLKIEAFKTLDPAIIKTYETVASGRRGNSMVIPSRGYNFFDFSAKNVNPKKVFAGKTNPFLDAHASSFAGLCKTLDVDGVIVASLYIDTPSVNFIAQGPKNLMLTVTFFDRDGKLCHSATDWMIGQSSTGGDLDSYTKMMDNYPLLVQRLVERLANVPKTSETGTPSVAIKK